MDIYALEYLDTYTKQILSSGLNMNTILLNDNFQPNRITNRLEICQKIYTTEDFWVNKRPIMHIWPNMHMGRLFVE